MAIDLMVSPDLTVYLRAITGVGAGRIVAVGCGRSVATGSGVLGTAVPPVVVDADPVPTGVGRAVVLGVATGVAMGAGLERFDDSGVVMPCPPGASVRCAIG